MNENETKNSLKLCKTCSRKAIMSRYEVELMTHDVSADWTWRIKLSILGTCLWIIRALTDVDTRFEVLTIDRGMAKWKNLSKNGELEPTRFP